MPVGWQGLSFGSNRVCIGSLPMRVERSAEVIHLP